MPASVKKLTAAEGLALDSFSKKEAARVISGGQRHVHSAAEAKETADAKLVRDSLMENKVPTLSWEFSQYTEWQLTSSAARQEAIDAIKAACKITRRELSDKVSTVLEELLTNGIYHSYLSEAGVEKYPRKKPAELAPKEALKIRFGADAQGIYLSVTDQGGSFTFEHFRAAIERCYSEAARQIESKDGGAGLGMYMVFEIATYLKIETQPGKSTTISVWIPKSRDQNPQIFAFDYFEWRNPQ